MTYVERDAEGAILTTYETAQWDGQEVLVADDAELVAYQTCRAELDAGGVRDGEGSRGAVLVSAARRT